MRLPIAAILFLAISTPLQFDAAVNGSTTTGTSGPTLDQTVDFIIRTVADQNPVRSVYRSQYQDGKKTQLMMANLDLEMGIRRINDCGLAIRLKNNYDGKKDSPAIEGTEIFSTIKNIQVRSWQDFNVEQTELSVQRPIEITMPATPNLYMILVDFGNADGGKQVIPFYAANKDLAISLSKAFAHAMILCGGDTKKLF